MNQAFDREEARSLDLVQRLVVSVLVAVVFGLPTLAVAFYSTRLAGTEPGNAIGLWVMSALLGLVTMGAVLLVHGRRPYSPLVLIGLVPAAVAAYWVF